MLGNASSHFLEELPPMDNELFSLGAVPESHSPLSPLQFALKN